MNNIPNRRDRRAAMRYQGILRQKTKFSFSQWLNFTRESIKQGKEIFEANRDAMEKSIGEQLEAKELAVIENWKEQGYNEEEIVRLREAWATLTIKDKETWHKDKKEARKILKEVQESYLSRQND